ncbi:hypothetical protein O9992_16290 [Vibrio lentus]|nr:hypothetical protein [Vibrio lentus]
MNCTDDSARGAPSTQPVQLREDPREVYAIGNREPISINVEDAKARGIKNGDLVQSIQRSGTKIVGALVTDGIKQGAVCIHEGGWPDLDKDTGL